MVIPVSASHLYNPQVLYMHQLELNEWTEQMFSLPQPVRYRWSIIILTDNDENFKMLVENTQGYFEETPL